MEITPAVVKGYQTSRLAEKAGPKTIDNEVLLRLCGDQGDLIRARQVENSRRYGARDSTERYGHDRARGARGLVHPAVRRVQAGVVRLPGRQGAAE